MNYNQLYRRPNYRPGYNSNNFLTPFLLGGLTGGLVAPIFYDGYRPYPNYGYYPYGFYR